MISSFHHQVGLLLELLGQDNDDSQNTSSLAVVMGGRQYYHRRHGAELRQCLRTIKQILSHEQEMESLRDGQFCTMDTEKELTPESDQDALRRREELCLFLDDLLTVACLENQREDPSAAALLNSIVVKIASSILPTLNQIIPFHKDQISSLLKRVFYLIQDVTEESWYLDHRVSSPESTSCLALLESLVVVLNENITPDLLDEIVDPSEAIPALQLPLELLCRAGTSGNLESSPLTPNDVLSLFLTPSLSYSLRVFLNSLLQHVNHLIVRDHERTSHGTAPPSIREWLQQQRQNKTAEKRSRANDGHNNSALMEMNKTTHSPGIFNACVTQEDSNVGFTTMGVSSVKELLRMMNQYGESLLDETMRLLQTMDSGNSNAEGDRIFESIGEDFGQARRPSNPTVHGMKNLEETESVLRMAHLTTDFLFLMDSEQAISISPTIFGALRSLWIEFTTFVLDTVSGGLSFQENDELQAAATEILFRLTKNYVGVLFRRDAVSIGQPSRPVAAASSLGDETLGLITTIFRLMQGSNEELWNQDGKEWVAFLLERHPHKSELKQALYAALVALTSCPEEDQIQEHTDSKYFTIMGLTGLDDADAGVEDIEDPWKSYVRDVLFPSSRQDA
jgi:hypothetical protein